MKEPGLWLLLDTAAPRGVIGVIEAGVLKAHRYLDETRRHAEELPGAIGATLTSAGRTIDDVTAVACGMGPGSFIGVRVAMSMAKGIALARQAPLWGVGSLLALAHQPALGLGVGWAVIDARRGELYAAKVERTARDAALGPPGAEVARILEGPRTIAPEVLAHDVEKGEISFGVGHLGSTGEALRPVLERRLGARWCSLAGPSAEGFHLALVSASRVDQLEALVPVYARDPDAKLPSLAAAPRTALIAE